MNDEFTCVVGLKNKSERNSVETIDLSTTNYTLLQMTKECLFYEFGERNFSNFKPRHGYGYRKVTSDDVKKIKNYKRVIVMEKVVSC